MSWQFVVELGAMTPGDMTDHARSDAVAGWIEALVYTNRLWLPFHPECPPLYASGVVFRAEAEDEPNMWRDIPSTLHLGYGHCVALTAWRLAELREKGETNARVRIFEWHLEDGRIDFHIHVLRADGSVEDPARRLGMP